MKVNVPAFIILLISICLQSCKVQKTLPELWQITPTQAPIGDEITLSGAQFGANPTVTVGNSGVFVNADIRNNNEQAIKILVPRIAVGPTQIRVANDNGISDPLPFTILQPNPLFSSVAPINGLSGAKVKITGDFLDKIKAVRFGDVQANEVSTTSQQEITVTVPANVPRGPLTITVETEGGRSTGDFIVTGTPEITSFSPKRTKAGAELIIQGRNLLDGVVFLNNLAVDKAKTQIQDTEIRTIIPESATTGKIAIRVFDKVQTSSADTLFIVPAPVISATGLSITEGLAGDKLTITGQYLRDVSSVSFGNTPAVFKVLSDTQLDVTVPARPQSGAVNITVAGTGGSTTSQQSFLLILAPTAITFTPTRIGRGKEIVISGQNLFRITDVKLNGKTVPIAGRTEGTDVRITVPTDATTGPVAVTNRAGTTTSVQSLTVVPKATVTSFTSSTTVGSRVVLRGNYLLNAKVSFTGSQTAAISDGKNEETEIWVKVPADAQTGPLQILNDSGETTTTTESFTLMKAPTSLDFTPKSGTTGAIITLTGQNLTGVKEVRFGGGKSTAAKFQLSNGALVITVPADAVTGTICLITDTGSVCTTGSFTVE